MWQMPVHQKPSGDLTPGEIRKQAGDKVILMGNISCNVVARN